MEVRAAAAAGGGGDDDDGGGGGGAVIGEGGRDEEKEGREDEDHDDEEQDTNFDTSFDTNFETSFSSVMTTPAARNASKSNFHFGGAVGSRTVTGNAKAPILDLSNKQEQEQDPRATRSGISRKRSSLGSTLSNINPTRTSVGQSHTKRTIAGQAGPDSDDDILARLQKSHREHKVHLIAMQKQLDLIRQAKRIEKASQNKALEQRQDAATVKTRNGGGKRGQNGEEQLVIDAELKELVQKWKLASRQAAEDLFELIKGRVADMGGAKAWRETRKRQLEGFHSAWDDEGQKGKMKTDDGNKREVEDSDVSDDGRFDDDSGLSLQRDGNNDDGEGVTEDGCEDSVRLLWQR